MTTQDRLRWDARYQNQGAPPEAVALPEPFAAHEDEFPATGQALELACGTGAFSVWLARRGLHVRGIDVSPVAIDRARKLAARNGVGDTCRFDVVDLDDGLPTGPSVDVLVCHRFRDPRLDQAIIERLAPGGLLAVTALSEVGAQPGRFRAKPGELTTAFAELEVIASGEGDGEAWLLARK